MVNNDKYVSQLRERREKEENRLKKRKETASDINLSKVVFDDTHIEHKKLDATKKTTEVEIELNKLRIKTKKEKTKIKAKETHKPIETYDSSINILSICKGVVALTGVVIVVIVGTQVYKTTKDAIVISDYASTNMTQTTTNLFGTIDLSTLLFVILGIALVGMFFNGFNRILR